MFPGVSGYLRVERGMSGRAEAWEFATELIEEEPVTGYGFMASTRFTETHRRILRRSGFSGAGTTFHNTFISRAVDLGLIVTAIYSLLYLVPLLRICRPTKFCHEQTLVRGMILLTLTAAIFRDYNIGGVRSTAMLGAMFLGLANLWHFASLWSGTEVASDSPAAELQGVATGNSPEYASPMS
jgi:O-antigen ligase